MMISDGYLPPVLSMLSEMHNVDFIGFWLKKFIRLGARIPNECVVDMLNLKAYINALFALNFDDKKPIPELYIYYFNFRVFPFRWLECSM